MTWLTQSNQQNARMSARSKAPNIGKIDVLSEQKATGCLGRAPHKSIILASQSFLYDGIHLMPQLG